MPGFISEDRKATGWHTFWSVVQDDGRWRAVREKVDALRQGGLSLPDARRKVMTEYKADEVITEARISGSDAFWRRKAVWIDETREVSSDVAAKWALSHQFDDVAEIKPRSIPSRLAWSLLRALVKDPKSARELFNIILAAERLKYCKGAPQPQVKAEAAPEPAVDDSSSSLAEEAVIQALRKEQEASDAV